jgi:hypothetical protein
MAARSQSKRNSTNVLRKPAGTEEHGLKPYPILSYADWKKGVAQPIDQTNTVSQSEQHKP